MTLAEAQAAALEADRLFPLSLAAEGTCTIGGNAATNAGGVTVIAYGNARELVTGVEAVLADGRIVNALSKLRKDNTGYDLKSLFVGSEGTLGVITAASLRLFPEPRARATAFVGLEARRRRSTFSAGARAARLRRDQFRVDRRASPYDITVRHGLARATRSSERPSLVCADRASSQIANGFDEAFGGPLEAALEGGVIDDAVLAACSTSATNSGSCARTSPRRRNSKAARSSTTSRSPSATSRPSSMKRPRRSRRSSPGRGSVAFGHLGDGNIHFNVTQPVGVDKAAYLARWDAMNDVVHAIVARMGGSFSAEHGVGRLKRHLLAETKDPGALAVMRAVKGALDPNGVMNPGKVL